MQNRFLTDFKPKPVRKPTVDAHLNDLPPLSRSTECIRYSLLSIEFWLSPDGIIREWLQKNLRWSAVLIIPTITAFPVVTLAVWELESWVNALTTLASKLVFLPILVLLVVVSITVVLKIIWGFKTLTFFI